MPSANALRPVRYWFMCLAEGGLEREVSRERFIKYATPAEMAEIDRAVSEHGALGGRIVFTHNCPCCNPMGCSKQGVVIVFLRRGSGN